MDDSFPEVVSGSSGLKVCLLNFVAAPVHSGSFFLTAAELSIV